MSRPANLYPLNAVYVQTQTLKHDKSLHDLKMRLGDSAQVASVPQLPLASSMDRLIHTLEKNTMSESQQQLPKVNHYTQVTSHSFLRGELPRKGSSQTNSVRNGQIIRSFSKFNNASSLKSDKDIRKILAVQN